MLLEENFPSKMSKGGGMIDFKGEKWLITKGHLMLCIHYQKWY
jgi:hypothetical protein